MPIRRIHSCLTIAFILWHAMPSSANGQSNRRPRPAVSEATLSLYEAGEFRGLHYRLMKPIDFDPQKNYPLILSLHGAGGRGNRNIKTLRNWNELMADETLRRKHPAFVLAPQTQMPWSDPSSPHATIPEFTDELLTTFPEALRSRIKRISEGRDRAARGDLGTVLKLIDTVIMKQFHIDPDRVYCLGHSMGGAGTFTAIYQHPNRFAAAIPTAGMFRPWYDPTRIKDIPIWAFHGDNDPTVPFAGSSFVFEKLRSLNGNMKLTTLRGVKHGAAVPAFSYTGDDSSRGFTTAHTSDRTDKTDDIWDWLFRQKRNR